MRTAKLTILFRLMDAVRPSRLNGVITHAFLGVGAPEAVLVGVVALVLFGPKGLAQAAKSLGQGVKAIAPTLKELTDISTDLKSTIEDEIGLNEIRDELQSTLSPISKPRPVGDVANLKDDDPDIAAKREESAKLAWSIDDDSGSLSSVQRKEVDSMSVEELEAELMRRKASEL